MYALNRTIYFLAQTLRRCGVNFHEDSDVRIQAMKKDIKLLGGVAFKIEQYPDGSWTAESTNVDGILTGAVTTKGMGNVIRDAIFTYYGIPPHLCKEDLLQSDHEAVTVRQQIYV